MRRTAVLSLLLSLCLFAPGLAAAQSVLEQALAAEVARTAAASGALGVNIVELDTGETVFSHRADEPRVIASNSKLFTTAAALDTLGPGYFFETRFLMRGAVERRHPPRGSRRGRRGRSADLGPRVSAAIPTAPFAPGRRRCGREGSSGSPAISTSPSGLFEPMQIHPEWPRDQLTDWYEAPIAALSFSDNCILVRVSPGAAGRLAVVETVPPVPIVRVDNSALTTLDAARDPPLRGPDRRPADRAAARSTSARGRSRPG